MLASFAVIALLLWYVSIKPGVTVAIDPISNGGLNLTVTGNFKTDTISKTYLQAAEKELLWESEGYLPVKEYIYHLRRDGKKPSEQLSRAITPEEDLFVSVRLRYKTLLDISLKTDKFQFRTTADGEIVYLGREKPLPVPRYPVIQKYK